jgi:phospholipase/carboxylesterase
LAGLICLSGYLHPLSGNSTSLVFPPILLVHGRQDTVVPLSAAQQSHEALVALGAKVQYQEFDMGHEIRPEVLSLVRNFILQVVPKPN